MARVPADIADLEAVERALDEHRVTNVIHLAALQVPFCRADPPLGARVNVVGTVNVLEAVRRRADRIGHVVYASSIAAYDELENGRRRPGCRHSRHDLRRVQARQRGHRACLLAGARLPSIGLRPHTVYGPGRDQGMTSTPTTAMLAAAAGLPYGSRSAAEASSSTRPDVAAAFIAAARAG